MGSQGELLGKLMAFVDQLGHWYEVLSDQKKSRNPLKKEEWQDLLLTLINDFYPQQAFDENG
jgi:exonuclease V gamma subunit